MSCFPWRVVNSVKGGMWHFFALCILHLHCFASALLCFAFALRTGAFPQGVAHVKIKKTLATPQISCARIAPPGGVKGALLQSVGIIFDVYLEWEPGASQQCWCISGPLSHRSRWGAKCAHATFDVDGLIHRVVLLLESRSR